MKLIKRALMTFALVRIAQIIAFGIRVGNLEQALNDKDNP
ncbi:gp3 [Corynebacterium phage P1201]|uniref:Gp3 n=1 Tax=Corynebacterium phage P1201 TaxID=384848 RepID=A7IY74_9CAUD|nr:gp3 [Corynebacterium phage P1201]ABF57457.1 gp3 [Corynebacterium phage P1201]